MLDFKPVSKRDAALLHRYYQNCDYGLCEYSVGVRLMWRKKLNACWAEVAGCLVTRSGQKGAYTFEYPVPGEEGNVEQALDAIEQWCTAQGEPLRYAIVPQSCLCSLMARYPYVCVSDPRNWRDYVYYREDLQLFAGRRYSGQRNHIRKFRTQWPDAEVRRLTAKDLPAIEQFWEDYEREFLKGDNRSARDELNLSKDLFRQIGKPWFLAGGMFCEGRIIALALGEKCGETLIVHIEKALYSYAGVYPTMVQDYANLFGSEVTYFNREDDAADRGLRTSKLQYGPAFLASKYQVKVQNELMHHADKIPTLHTQRLTLTTLREEDIPAYNALVLDQERNRLWGYDDVGGLGGAVEERSFFEVAQRDFANRLAVNFALRLDGKFIGEAVLYNFDGRGSAELGCRVDSAYAGHGYGTEAFAAVADWGLYHLNLNVVKAKCFHENEASYKMLSSCMRKSGKDETYFYFEKPV